MIPYIEIPPLMIWGPIAIQPFGVLVLTGCIVGFLVARRYAGSRGLAQDRFFELAIWVLVLGFTLSHLVSMLLYFPETVRSRPISLINLAGSMSSFGGFFGGGFGAIIYLKINKLPVLEYGDASLVGLVVGWFFGRLGCTIAHDHPGIHSDFFLAVKYPGGARHDLGFYEWLFTIGLIVVLIFIRRAGLPPGAIIGAVFILYAPVRFLLDFLRVGDKLYFGLTPGQYFSVILIPLGVFFLLKAYKKHRSLNRS
jgi:phosphatidylglycerol:prolipoprotein diacylglycerol transferase